MTRATADLVLLLAAAIWGLAFVFQKTAMETVGPFTFIASRCALAALVLAPLAWFEHARADRPVQAGFARLVVLAAAAFLVAGGLQQAGLLTATVTNAGFLTALYVILVPFVAWIALARPPATLVWPAALVSFIGTWLLGGGTSGQLSSGDQLVAASAVAWAVHVVVTSQASHHARPIAFTCLQFVLVALGAGALAAANETVTLAGLWAAAPEIAYVGLLSSALTFTLLAIALKHTPPADAAIIVSTENLFAALAGALLLGERLPAVGWAGAALIVAAILIVQVSAARTRP